MLKINLIFLFLLMFVSSKGFSTNLKIENVTYSAPTSEISFDISWENSWRLDASSDGLHDAVWVFVKYKSCDSELGFFHVLLSTTMTDHTLETGLMANAIDNSPDNTGIMLRRSDVGSGDITPKRVTLALLNIPSDATEIKVYGTEMTYIKEDAFYVGDGLRNRNILREGGDNGNTLANSYYIDSENLIPVGDQVGKLWCTETRAAGWGPFTIEQPFLNLQSSGIPSTYPKGYKSFYAMKTEITQQQYADFLNSLSRQDVYRYYSRSIPFGRTIDVYGKGYPTDYHNLYSLQGSWPNISTSGRPHQAQAILNWYDIMGFLSWAALRPLTELEYEKVCRGPELPMPYQFPWGDTSNRLPGQRVNLGTAEETVTNVGQEGVSNTIFPGYNNMIYAMRVGYQGKEGLITNRKTLAAGYYGNLGLGDNVFEWYVAIRDNSMGYEGSWGKGNLQLPSSWQNITGTPRNGGWGLGQSWEMSISGRNFLNRSSGGRILNVGGRGGR